MTACVSVAWESGSVHRIVRCTACGARVQPVSGFCSTCLARLPATTFARAFLVAGLLALQAALLVDAAILDHRTVTGREPAPAAASPSPAVTSSPALADATIAPTAPPAAIAPTPTASASQEPEGASAGTSSLPSTATDPGVRLGEPIAPLVPPME